MSKRDTSSGGAASGPYPDDYTPQCRYCGAPFPPGAPTSKAMHEVYDCPERPAEGQETLDQWGDE